MHYLKAISHFLDELPRFLLKLPRAAQLGIAIFSAVFTLTLYMLLSPAAKNPSILVIPLVIIAWMFRRVGALLFLVVAFVSLWIYYSLVNPHVHYFLLPINSVITFIAGTIAIGIIGFFVSSQRDSFDLIDEARYQIAKAFEHEQLLNRSKDQFIQNVNHELRTPLTALSGYIELLLEHDESLNSQARQGFLRNAMYSCEELQLLVSNVLDSLQIQNEKEHLQLEELSVTATIEDVLNLSDPRMRQKHLLEQDISPELKIWAHALYLRQVLRNLLSNAYKYAPAGSKIIISADLFNAAANPDKQEIRVSIRDFGPGIPPEELPHLFGQFVRLQRDVAGKVRGTGLGLYISKQLIEAMGGRIWVESSGKAGEGSCFSFTLPRAMPVHSTSSIGD